MAYGAHAAEEGSGCYAFFGTYTGGTSKGIYVSRFDSKSGALSEPALAAESKNPSFLAVHPSQRWLYAVSETSQTNGKPTGGVSAFSIDRQTGRLTLLNKELSGGAGPCHLALDNSGKCLLVANYGGGSVSVLKISADGKLLPGSTIQHSGASVNPKRQSGPHAHQAVASPDNQFALVCDLGLDKVMIYKLDSEAASLQPNVSAPAALHPGAGPRHLAFRPDGKFLYVINELDSTMTAFAWNEQTGECGEVQKVSTLPEGYAGESYCAEVMIHPNGQFVYGSNRGHDSIVVFSSDRKTGKLKTVNHTSSGGKFPRHITIDPTGKWFFSLNQNSGDIVVMKVDVKTGKLSDPVSKLLLGSPVCAVFVPAAPTAQM